ncbi:zinc-binding dehydrogenase [Altererythrobacter sp. BO-6]|uniref:zinc-binding dehydrogenase n=1 Tax=Altererythrobacter sp. BO-6 TaxID=2604537 RepID=UPI0013E1759A|nr:zinc-binding dehydrogenase [Altererythrobacter sp. BO-6]QIG53627.1 zinc-binding dehydrogenase [Altererythrobacter sp. BO-6]
MFGHEGAGVVVETGSAVTKFQKGDRVIATFGSCGACANCQGGHPAYCFDGIALNIEGMRAAGRPALTRPDGSEVSGAFFQQSSFATHAIATERNLVRIPDGLDMVTAAPLGCGIQTGAGAVFNQLGAKEGRPLLVIGAGAVGLAAIMAGRIIGCDPIVAVELMPARRELALALGATQALDGAESDWVAQVRSITQGGASAALDTAGTQATFEGSLAAIHSGGTLGVLTLPGPFDAPISHPGGLDFMTKTIVGVIEGDAVPQTFLPLLIAHHAAGDLPVDRLIRTYPFEKISEAFADAAAGRTIKPVLTFGDEC